MLRLVLTIFIIIIFLLQIYKFLKKEYTASILLGTILQMICVINLLLGCLK